MTFRLIPSTMQTSPIV